MLIPVTVRYDLESIATPYSITESPYVHFKHDEFFVRFRNINFVVTLHALMLVWLTSYDIKLRFYGCYHPYFISKMEILGCLYFLRNVNFVLV